MKKLFCLLLMTFFAGMASAQEVEPSWENGKVGLKNFRTGQWAVKPTFNDARYLGSYEGKHYYGVKTVDNLWGFIRSDDYSRYRVSPRYANIASVPGQWRFPVVGVQTGGNWGVIELYTDHVYYLVNCQFRSISIYVDDARVFPWEGDSYCVEFGPAFNKALEKAAKAKEAGIKKVQEEKRQEAERAARIQKEKELSSFTEYAKNYVTPRVNEWQKKGEFEKIADYQLRVTGANRIGKINQYTAEAERLFVEEHAKLNHIADMTLEQYDSENEVFSIKSAKFGQLLLPVPISDGPSFKANFATVRKTDPQYFIENDKIALRSLTFTDSVSGKSFVYRNNAALKYSNYTLNPDVLDIESVRITATTTTTVRGNVKPTCEILSPRKDDKYYSGTVKVQYTVKVADGLDAQVRISVNGKVVEPKQLSGTSKGVRMVDVCEAEIEVPRKNGEICVLTLQPIDSEGTWGESKAVEIIYAGEQPKPGLHILAVGISNYLSKDLEDLNYAAKDAQDFVKTISSSNLSMYSGCSSAVMTDREATAVNIKRALNNLSSEVPQGDVVMVYFSGHGVHRSGEAYFMATDTSMEDYYNGVEFDFINKRLNMMADEKGCHVVLFMDACHSGAMLGMKGATEDFAKLGPGVVGFYSSTKSQQSAELAKMENGVFTKALLEGLKGKASNKEGEITIQGLGSYILERVKQEMGKNQTPVLHAPVGDAVLFRVR